MKTFTIDTDNNISVFATKKEAAAASITPFDLFANQDELAELATAWPASRLVEIWNSLPGVTPVKKFKDSKTGIARIWKAIQSLGGVAAEVAPKPEAEVAEIAAVEAQPEPASAEPPVALEPVAIVDAVPTDATTPATPTEPTPAEPVAYADAHSAEVAPVETTPTKKGAPREEGPQSA